LSATLSFTKEKLRRYDTGLIAFDENIVSLKSTYQFSRFLFARGRVDFDSREVRSDIGSLQKLMIGFFATTLGSIIAGVVLLFLSHH